MNDLHRSKFGRSLKTIFHQITTFHELKVKNSVQNSNIYVKIFRKKFIGSYESPRIQERQI